MRAFAFSPNCHSITGPSRGSGPTGQCPLPMLHPGWQPGSTPHPQPLLAQPLGRKHSARPPPRCRLLLAAIGGREGTPGAGVSGAGEEEEGPARLAALACLRGAGGWAQASMEQSTEPWWRPASGPTPASSPGVACHPQHPWTPNFMWKNWGDDQAPTAATAGWGPGSRDWGAGRGGGLLQCHLWEARLKSPSVGERSLGPTPPPTSASLLSEAAWPPPSARSRRASRGDGPADSCPEPERRPAAAGLGRPGLQLSLCPLSAGP